MNENELQRTLEGVLGALEQLSVPYHVTDGLAASYYGEPRLTQDIDLVVRLRPELTDDMVQLLEPEFLVQAEVVCDVVRRQRMFQALHRNYLIKVDFHVVERITGELERSVCQPLFDGLDVRMVSKADAIVSKLIWIREGSEKSRMDVVGMLIDPTPFDRRLLDSLTTELGCAETLREIERGMEDR